jgi:hypothetical protein
MMGMQDTTVQQINNATYTNGRYYVHGWKNDRGTFTVLSAKKGLYRRSAVTWFGSKTCATYQEATEAFKELRTQIDQIVSDKSQKRISNSISRKIAIAAYKQNTLNPWKVGDMCHTSWGYDQTNVDAYQVVEVWSRTQISVRPIGGDIEQTGWLRGQFTPKQNQFTGEAIKVTAGFSYWAHGNTVSENWMVKGHSLYETKPGESHYFSSYA